MSSYTAHENALKNAMELKEQGDIEGALEELHLTLHGKKFRGNNIILEKVIIEMIDLCGDNLITTYLKEDIGHFRNVCQHTNMTLLENVLKKLKDRADDAIKRCEEENGFDKLKQLLGGANSEEDADTQAVSAFLSGDQAELNPEELMLLANCNFEQVESKQSLMNRVAFFIDVCKIILDTLRQNSKMIDFYNQTAQRVFDFCCKYNYRVEYVRVAETLHSHFNQIIKISKHPELSVQSKIPFPIRLDEEDALQKVLELRYHQLKLSLELKIWSDAFRTTENIYQLINRQKHHASRMKQILSDFFQNLSEIFWQSEFYLFHAYAIMNLQQIIKFNKTLTDQKKAEMNAKLVLSVLSVPLNNRLSNFERLSFQYHPPGMNHLQDSNPTARHELFNIANMLQVKGIPSRSSLINYLRIKNLHLSSEFPLIQELFRLIEDEESPFTLSKQGSILLEKISTSFPSMSQYKPFLIKTLSVRILQKCRNYFKNLKLSTLKSLLQFYDSFDSIETLLYECNSEALIKTVLNHETSSVTFDQEVEVTTNLVKFGHKLKTAFQLVQEATTSEGGRERERIFMKVKEKIEQEMGDVLKRKVDMELMKEQIARTQAQEKRSLEEILEAQRLEREKDFVVQQIKEEKERQKNKLLDELELMRKIRAQEVLQELIRRGVKKIGNVKISDMERKGEFDYDEVMNFYQMLLKKEKEAFEGEKQKKIKDVEYWARAVREEEKVAIEKYAKEHGDEEMKQIQKAVRERHEKELKLKQSLEKANSTYLLFHAAVMKQRQNQHEDQMQAFIVKKGIELQGKIVTEAKSELLKVENIRKVREKEERDKKIMKEKEAKDRAEGKIPVDEEGGSTGWARGSVAQPVISSGPKREDREGGEAFLGRSAMGISKPVVEEKKDDGPKRPTFSKQVKKDDGGPTMTRDGFGKGALTTTTSSQSTKTPKDDGGPTMSRDGFGSGALKANTSSQSTTTPKTEDKKDSTSDNQWKTTTASSKPVSSQGNAGGFCKGSSLQGSKSDKQPESSGGPWRSSGPQNSRGGKKQ